MTTRSIYVRRTVSTVLPLVLLVALGGCWGSGPDDNNDDPGTQMDAIAAEIQATLTARPDVASATVFYNNDVTDPGFANASITVKAGTALQPVEDEAVKIIWQSRFAPLKTIRIGIQDAADTTRSDILHLDADGKDKATLEGRYGPRPK